MAATSWSARSATCACSIRGAAFASLPRPGQEGLPFHLVAMTATGNRAGRCSHRQPIPDGTDYYCGGGRCLADRDLLCPERPPQPGDGRRWRTAAIGHFGRALTALNLAALRTETTRQGSRAGPRCRQRPPVVADIQMTAPRRRPDLGRGLSRDGDLLYVGDSGSSRPAIATLDARTGRSRGHLRPERR